MIETIKKLLRKEVKDFAEKSAPVFARMNWMWIEEHKLFDWNAAPIQFLPTQEDIEKKAYGLIDRLEEDVFYLCSGRIEIYYNIFEQYGKIKWIYYGIQLVAESNRRSFEYDPKGE